MDIFDLRLRHLNIILFPKGEGRVYQRMYHDGSSLYLWHVQSLRPGRPGGASLWLSLSSVPAAESDRGRDKIRADSGCGHSGHRGMGEARRLRHAAVLLL